MLATLTSKGQVTLPKEIREKLGLKAIEAELRVVAAWYRQATPCLPDRALDQGMLKRPGQRPVSIEEMDEGIAAFLERKHGRTRR